ncbi:WxL protein peptidoglycan domain-containing protein [Streptomyces sp. NPDC021224]|uniref:WxL protein peptidoglycan domain-containing protein n=1 Tax=unclassified Streptomyces TaxID=2593676 RepID=UPI00378BC0EE
MHAIPPDRPAPARATARATVTARPRTRAVTVVLALLAAVAATLAGPGSGAARAAGGDVSWTVRTASNSYGSDRSSFGYSVNPGGTVEDTMTVANHGTRPLTLSVYAADGFTTATGQLDLLTRDRKSTGVGAWTRPGHDSLTVAPGKTADVPFTLAVPAGAAPGDYVGGILTSLEQPDAGQGITVDRRLGIKIALRVGGALRPALKVEDLRVGYSGTANPFGSGDASVTYTIRNTGNATLSARQAVSVSGPFGWFTAGAKSVAAPPALLPGETWKVEVPVHGVTPGVRLAATVTLTPLLTDASGSTSALKPVRATAHGWAVPWTLALTALLLAVAAAAAVLLFRRARVRAARREDARVREAVERTLREHESSL